MCFKSMSYISIKKHFLSRGSSTERFWYNCFFSLKTSFKNFWDSSNKACNRLRERQMYTLICVNYFVNVFGWLKDFKTCNCLVVIVPTFYNFSLYYAPPIVFSFLCSRFLSIHVLNLIISMVAIDTLIFGVKSKNDFI